MTTLTLLPEDSTLNNALIIVAFAALSFTAPLLELAISEGWQTVFSIPVFVAVVFALVASSSKALGSLIAIVALVVVHYFAPQAFVSLFSLPVYAFALLAVVYALSIGYYTFLMVVGAYCLLYVLGYWPIV